MADQTPVLQLKPPVGGPRRRLRLAVAGGVRAPERVRAWLGTGAAWVPDEVRATLLLLVSELVNNAVRHGGAGRDNLIEVELRAIEDGIGVQVTDPGPGFAPADRERALEEPGGWGLVLVDQMSQRWGVVHDDCTRVWFELGC